MRHRFFLTKRGFLFMMSEPVGGDGSWVSCECDDSCRNISTVVGATCPPILSAIKNLDGVPRSFLAYLQVRHPRLFERYSLVVKKELRKRNKKQ